MKKRTKRKQNPVLLPLGMKRLNLIEMPGHVALLALGQPWMNDSHMADLFSTCVISEELSDNEEISSLADTGIKLLSEGSTDYDQIKKVIGTLITWVSSQPNKDVHDAVLKIMRRSYGPR